MVRIHPPLLFLSRLGNRDRNCHYYKFNFNNAACKGQAWGVSPLTANDYISE